MVQKITLAAILVLTFLGSSPTSVHGSGHWLFTAQTTTSTGGGCGNWIPCYPEIYISADATYAILGTHAFERVVMSCDECEAVTVISFRDSNVGGLATLTRSEDPGCPVNDDGVGSCWSWVLDSSYGHAEGTAVRVE